MDFDSLARRDLQFFCKRNKIPANMTNLAMADALKSLEIVEGVEEFKNQSPTSVARNMPSAARTAARRKVTKDETESAELVTRSCYVPKMEQENRNANVVPSRRRSVAMKLDVESEAKTPAVKVGVESVQRVYSTRRSVKLLEEYMADLSLKTNEPKVNKEDSPQGSKVKEVEVIAVGDLSEELEKEWDGSMNDPDLDGLYGDLGDITFFDANTTKEQLNVIESKSVQASDSFVLVDGEEKSQEDEFVVVEHAASPTTTNIVACNKELEPEEMKNDVEAEETEYETDPSEDDDSGVVVDDSNHEVLESKVSVSDNVSKLNSVPVVLIADEPKEVESEPEEEEISESDEVIDDDNESEVSQVSDMKKAQASFSPRPKKEHESDSDEWSDFEIEEIDEDSLASEEMVDSESESAPVSDKKKTLASPVALVEDKNKENVEEEIVLVNNSERKEAAETKKKEAEKLKEVSMRQLTKMVKELDIKNKSRPQHKYL